MMSLVRPALFAGAVGLALTGCGGHGFLGTNYYPTGDITITNEATGSIITTSQASPFVESVPAFEIGIAETNFSGPYTVTMVSWNNGFNKPCFEPTQISTTTHANVWQFNAVNAAAAGTPANENPCDPDGTDEEVALISDGKGHSINFYFLFG